MLQLQPPKLLLHPADLRDVGFHVLVPWFVYFVGEVDKELRITPDGEALHPQGDCGLQACYQAFVFCYVVGDLLSVLEAELHGVIEFVLGRGHKHCASSRTMSGECPIEVHDLAVRCFTSRGK